MVSTLAAANAITKIGYDDIHDQLDNFLVALNLLEKNARGLTQMNREVQFSARMQRSNGIGARNESDNLPTARESKDARASLYLKYQYGRIQGTGQVFEQVSDNTEGFVDWMTREMNDIKESLQRDLSRQFYGDGTGTLATLTAGATSATQTVDSTWWLEVGMWVDVLTAATLGNSVPTPANASVLNVVSMTATTVTFDQSITATTGSVIVRADADRTSGMNNWKKEWEGLGLILQNNAVLHTIDPAAYPRWNPGYVQTGVGTLTELTLSKAVQAIQKQGGSVTDILIGNGVMNAYWNVLQGQRRFVNDGDSNLRGGVTKPAFQGVGGANIPITVDPFAPRGFAYFLNTKELFIRRAKEWQWMDKDGAIWSRVSGKDAYEATVYQYSNIGTFRRNTHGVLSGITEP